ncbi:hypothetical protein V6242_18655, partial [Marinomonas arenicola]
IRHTLVAMIALLFESLACYAHAESVVSSLDNNNVAENQVVQLTLRADFNNTGKGPDLSALKKNFDVLGQ